MTDDAIDRYIERVAREEEDDIDRQHGQFILDVTAARMQQGGGEDALLEAINRAHQAKASEAEADQQ